MTIGDTFRSAITEQDGVTVNVAYLTMYCLAVMVLGAIPVLTIGAFVEMYYDVFHRFHSQELGVAIGAVCTGFATTIGAVGLFLKGDRSKP